MTTVLFARLERLSTQSYMTYKLPKPMTTEHAEVYVSMYLKGWEVINTTSKNPDHI